MNLKPMNNILKRCARVVIRCYQTCLSPLLGSHCRFFPSCSEYAHEAVEQFGPFRGTFKTLSRLARCHPFHTGGYDPVSK